MVSLLLAIIYVAFISLGLPDSLLGSAWPVMSVDLNVPISFAGFFSMIMTSATVVSSLLSARLTRKFGPGLVTAVSVSLTAIALLCISFANSYLVICLLALPYGFGAGGVDAALNNYVAIHYKARHMSWLHCFWGIGASLSPYIMAHFLAGPNSWKGGYEAVGLIQIVFTIVIFMSLPLWSNVSKKNQKEGETLSNPVSIVNALKIKGVPLVLITFFCYCALETTTGLWATTYLVNYRGINVETAARFASLFYLGITLGRFQVGFIAEKVGDKKLIRYGILVAILGIILIMIPVNIDIISLIGLIIVGLGCAPIYPSIIHSTPSNFGKEQSHAIVGIQMASAYLGSTFMPPIFGVIAKRINIALYPIYLIIFALAMFVASEAVNRMLLKKQVKNKANN